MIDSIKLLSKPTNGQFGYLSERDNLKLSSFLENGVKFSNKTNVLIGKNGSGKSTILNIIRAANMCSHSTTSSFNLFDFRDLEDLLNNFEIKSNFHLPVFNLYRLKEDVERLTSNNIETRDDMVAFLAATSESNGQNLIGDLNVLLDDMFSKKKMVSMASIIEGLEKTKTVKNILDSFIKNQVDDMLTTVLMDEPDQGLDIENIKEIYGVLTANREDTQLIAAIHNPLLIYKLSKLDFVNIVETTPGYLKSIYDFVEG